MPRFLLLFYIFSTKPRYNFFENAPFFTLKRIFWQIFHLLFTWYFIWVCFLKFSVFWKSRSKNYRKNLRQTSFWQNSIIVSLVISATITTQPRYNYKLPHSMYLSVEYMLILYKCQDFPTRFRLIIEFWKFWKDTDKTRLIIFCQKTLKSTTNWKWYITFVDYCWETIRR